MALAAGGRVRRAIDDQYAHKQRADSLRWICVNTALLLVFTLDLWWACPGYRSALHYVEGALACAAAVSAARHAGRLLRAPPGPAAPAATPAVPAPAPPAQLSPARSWRAEPPVARPEPSPPAPRTPPDAVIADRAHLDRYLSHAAQAEEAWSALASSAPPPPAYQVSPLRSEPAPAARATAAGGDPWRRVLVEPARLARFELDLRRWLHATVLGRLARELDAADTELAAVGQDARTDSASTARLETLAGSAPAPLARRLRGLLPFLRPFAEPAHMVRRVRALARSPCLAGYRWDGGGAGRDCPSDAELLVRLLAAYLDGTEPDGAVPRGPGAFTATHLSRAPAPPPRAPAALALHLAAAAPPHYAVVVGAEVLEPPAGRANLPAALLVFLSAAARREPPALLRLHLGPAGLNMLWMLDN